MYNFKDLNTSLKNDTDLIQRHIFFLLSVLLIVLSEDRKAIHCSHWLTKDVSRKNGMEQNDSQHATFPIKVLKIITMLRSSKDEKQSNVCILILLYRPWYRMHCRYWQKMYHDKMCRNWRNWRMEECSKKWNKKY